MTMRPDMYQFHNGEKACLPFSDTEYEARLSLLRATMRQVGCNAAVLTSMHNIAYYAGFLYCAFGRPYALVVTAEQSVTISAGIDAGQPLRWSYGDNLTYSDWKRDNFWRAIHHVIGAGQVIGYGHLFGVLSYYYGREAGLELREDIETVITPGMVISMEPMLTLPQGMPGAGGYREHDSLLITKTCNERLTGYLYEPDFNIVG